MWSTFHQTTIAYCIAAIRQSQRIILATMWGTIVQDETVNGCNFYAHDLWSMGLKLDNKANHDWHAQCAIHLTTCTGMLSGVKSQIFFYSGGACPGTTSICYGIRQCNVDGGIFS